MPSKRLSSTKRKNELSSEKTSSTLHSIESQNLNNSYLVNGVSGDIIVNEFEDLFMGHKKRSSIQSQSQKYSYLFSENYQSIEKLLNQFGKSMKSRNTFPECQIVDELNKKKIHKSKKDRSRRIEHPNSQGSPVNLKNRRGNRSPI